MKYEDLATKDEISKHFGTTPNNIGRTYKNKKPIAYRVMCIGTFVLASDISPDELFEAISLIKTIKKGYDDK